MAKSMFTTHRIEKLEKKIGNIERLIKEINIKIERLEEKIEKK